MSVPAELWALVVKPDPTIWAAIFSVMGAVVAGLLGGWVSGVLTRAAARDGAEQANRLNQLQQAREATARAVAFVQAIQAEAEALWILVNRDIAPAVRAIDVQRPMIAKFVISDGYFSVYDSNAVMLGLVDDRNARKNIVKTFIAARAFVDTIKTNNLLVERYEHMPDADNFGPDYLAGVVQKGLAKGAAKAELETFSNGVLFAWQELESKIGVFYDSTNAWLIKNGAQANPPPQFVHV